MLTFQINIGITSTDCAAPQDVNEGILLQFSINGGVTWTTLLNIAYNDNSAETKTVIIPNAAQTSFTRFRWWQRFNPGLNLAQWSLDNVKINHIPVVLDGFFEDFESDVQAISDYDGSIRSYCTSDGRGLVLKYVTNHKVTTYRHKSFITQWSSGNLRSDRNSKILQHYFNTSVQYGNFM